MTTTPDTRPVVEIIADTLMALHRRDPIEPTTAYRQARRIEKALDAAGKLGATPARNRPRGHGPCDETVAKAARVLHIANCCNLSDSAEHQEPQNEDIYTAGVVLNAVPLDALAGARVAPREPSPVASTPTVSDDSGHGGDDDRGGREDGPEDEGRSHQATVAGTPQRPSGCAECHRASGHKMDCSHRFAAQPMLDPEKVRLVIAHSVREGMKFGDLYRIADALCEAAKRGELT
ncbi:hypothetical protein [Leucobacter sp. VD1]|uniref:hypothetical protein n=1 Tax=Leucobacter sp. VD1 TaxID=3080381 RepID=UPI003019DBEA